MKLLFVYSLAFLFAEIALCQHESPIFHRTFSNGCAAENIQSESDCPLMEGKNQWSEETKTSESDKRFKSISDPTKKITKKCFYKLSVHSKTCNAKPECTVTMYRYLLPKPPRNVDLNSCSNEWSMQSSCKANGPGGKNTKAVYFSCFQKGSRPYCGVKFESCTPEQCFEWGGWRRQCYVECSTPSVTGVALQFVRSCKECDGAVTESRFCTGEPTQIRRCVRRDRAKAKWPFCEVDETTRPDTTTIFQSTNASTTITTIKTTEPVTTPTTTQPTTTNPTTTTPEATTPISTTKETTKKTTAQTKKTTTKSAPTKSHTTTTEDVPKSTAADSAVIIKISPTEPVVEHTTISVVVPQKSTKHTLGASPAGYNGSDNDSFYLITIGGGAGAGIVFVSLIAIIIFLLTRSKRDAKSPSDASYSTSSNHRPKSPKNPVVDSSSFRIATWIRERPALPSTSVTSSDPSVVSDAEYWKIGVSDENVTEPYDTPDPPSESDARRVPDIVKTASIERGEEHVYDEVEFGDFDDKGTMVFRNITPRKSRHISVNSSQSEPATGSVEWPPDDSAVYAVVRKTWKKELQRSKKKLQRSSDSSDGDLRKRIPSEHSASVTRLNGRHLREGVLQIEFDEKEGIRCKLSDSNVYINLEETEPPPVI